MYWYSRRTDSLQRLDCSTGPVTSLAMVETSDIMLAVGSSLGDLIIFQIPKPVIIDVGVSFPGTVQNIQEFSIKDVHTAAVSALAWAKNGERLFSGDTAGTLVMSVVDFFINTVQTSFLSRQESEVVSLSYQDKLLLVSSLSGSFLVDLSQGEAIRRSVDGSSKAGLGSCLLQEGVGRSSLKCLLLGQGDTVAVSDLDGNTERSLMFHEALRRQHTQIPLLNPISIARDEEANCGNILVLSHEKQTAVLWSKVGIVFRIKGN